jgi:glycine/D-amino acid oxidase-like deaminating enzyme
MSLSSEKTVICGAGIAGISAAYYLAVEHGCRNLVIVEEGHPLSLTSAQSTEAYRNWWPGPDRAMTAFMNRSIDLMEEIAHITGNRINLNRRGYLYATADAGKISWLHDIARRAEVLGSGPVRVHETASSLYAPSPERGFDVPFTGADLLIDRSLIHRCFPFLAPNTVAVIHARRAGWLSAQQLGMVMLEAARERGASLLRGKVVGVNVGRSRIRSVDIEQDGQRWSLQASRLVLAAGPMQKEMASLMGIDLPIIAERHRKVSFSDPRGVMCTAPMLIWLDEQRLPWSHDECAALAESDGTQWLLGKFPAGMHGRPEGSGSTASLVVLFNHDHGPCDVVFPLPEEMHYAEIALRGLSTMVPGLSVYIGKGARPHVDGGYYIKTRENRPLIGPLPVDGAYISGAFSGFGVMASCAAGDLLARHITEKALPEYAPAFLPSRYQDAKYSALLDNWGDGGQL